VLDVLQERGVQATFFLVAERVRRDPGLARRVAEAGHEVGLHGDTHVDLRGTKPIDLYRSLRRGRRDVERVVGQQLRWFRPPYGTQEPETVAACRAVGLQSVLWSATALDWRNEPIERQIEHAFQDLAPGGVLLLHDGSARIAQPPPPPPPTQPELLERILDRLDDLSLAPVPIRTLCAAGAPVREQWFEQWLHG
jgi:peptidoglycan/xylan/chitin deacetylase (PgdA/CDA1 family)